ncbi:TPA: Mth938-like domain-containing protein [Legionella pneumophila]|nr:Mth938-like domain-containing protein [Legionella pneumophila]HAT2065162.1 Xcc1710-like domain-containing protein [Legionella pneumophila]HAT8591468.1 hypothetical protein [Legionella pneumophila]HAU1575390.1 hypothetical protein [Legionella pneumophila]HAU1681657.1 hypothetical protein [Legionella pneumophila]HAU3699076.1 hypothetical protein [Legionella pneumophila]
MNINLETAEQHAVQAYSDKKIQINSIIYESSLIVSKKEIITDFVIKDIQDINDSYIDLLLRSKPELIIIGHLQTGKMLPVTLISQLSQKRIGIECMSIGGACRTYNVLLSEHRAVAAGFIF